MIKRSFIKKIVAVVSTLAISTSMLAVSASAYTGKDRYDTCGRTMTAICGDNYKVISKVQYPSSVIIANGDTVKDTKGKALTGASSITGSTWSAPTLAYVKNAPVFYIPNTTTSDFTNKNIKKIFDYQNRDKLNSKEQNLVNLSREVSHMARDYFHNTDGKTFTVYVLGNTKEIPSNITNFINSMYHPFKGQNIDIKRIYGKNKIDTNAKIMNMCYNKLCDNNIKNLVICQSNSYQNLVTATNYNAPVMLVDKNNITADQVAFIENNNIKKVTLCGQSFSASVVKKIRTASKLTNKNIYSSTLDNYTTNLISIGKTFAASKNNVKNGTIVVNANAPIDCITAAVANSISKNNVAILCEKNAYGFVKANIKTFIAEMYPNDAKAKQNYKDTMNKWYHSFSDATRNGKDIVVGNIR